MSSMIKRSTPIPIDYEETFQTVADNQTKASIEIYEGIKLSKTNFIILNKINNLKQKQTRNINILTFHKSHNNIPNNYNVYINNEFAFKITKKFQLFKNDYI